MKSLFLIPFLIVALSVSSVYAPQQAVQAETGEDEIELIALRMYADWCGYCKTLDAKLDEIKPEFKDTGVWFTYFDFTDEFTTSQTELQAKRVNMSGLFESYKGKTGVLLLVNPATGAILQEINSEMSQADLKAAIHKHL